MANKLKINLNIYHGKNSLSKIEKLLKAYNFKKPLLLLDKNLDKIKYIRKNTNFIKNKRLLSFIFEPTYQMLNSEKAYLKI